MSWYKIAETSAEKASFLMLDLSYYPAFLELKKKTKVLEKFVSYIDRKNNLISEFMNDDDKNQKSVFGFKFFMNNKNFNQYKLDVEKIIVATNQYKRLVDKIDLYKISCHELISLFEKGRIIYHKALGIYLLSQPEYISNIENYLKKQLSIFVPQDKVEEILITLTLSVNKSCLEKERVDWLINVVLPVMKKYKKFNDIKNNSSTFLKIKKHVSKYKYYSAGAEFGLWDEQHYQKILKEDFKSSYEKILKECLNTQNRGKHILKKKTEIIKKYNINSDILNLLEVISELGLLRINLRILGWQFFNYLFPLLINSSAKKIGISKEIVNSLSYTDYIEFLRGNLDLSTKKIKKSTSALVLITPKCGYKFFYNELADRKFNSKIKEKLEKKQNFKGVVAYKQGVINGNVFLFIWGSKNFNQRIYNFPKNAILVTGQTRPLLVPAIRKARAIITDEGGLLCHAAIISRELKIPCIIGTKIATKILKDGDLVEIDTNTGFVKILEKNA